MAREVEGAPLSPPQPASHDSAICRRCGDLTALTAEDVCPGCEARAELDGPRGRALPFALAAVIAPFLITVPFRLIIHGGIEGARLSLYDILMKLGMSVFLVLGFAIRHFTGLDLPPHALAFGLMLGWLAAAAMASRRSDFVTYVAYIIAGSQTVIGLFMAWVIR